VSVVVAAFNTESYIGEAVRSVLGQTMTDLELIVVDDGSTDRTARVVQSIEDPRMRLVREHKRGVSHARNRAIALSSASWIAVLDSDDYLASDWLERLLAIAETDPADMIFGDIVLVDEHRRRTGTFFEELGLALSAPVEIDGHEFIAGRILGCPTPRPGLIRPLIRRGFLAEHGLHYAEDLTGAEDWLLYCQCLARGARMLAAPVEGYFYRARPGSASLTDPLGLYGEKARAIEHLARDPLLPPSLERRVALLGEENRRLLAFAALRRALLDRRPRAAMSIAIKEPSALLRLVRHAAARIRATI
jgi:succinoglycan biosynthesis protein ExoO